MTTDDLTQRLAIHRAAVAETQAAILPTEHEWVAYHVAEAARHLALAADAAASVALLPDTQPWITDPYAVVDPAFRTTDLSGGTA